jgi:hypothetical protein
MDFDLQNVWSWNFIFLPTNATAPGLPDFSLCKTPKNGENFTK